MVYERLVQAFDYSVVSVLRPLTAPCLYVVGNITASSKQEHSFQCMMAGDIYANFYRSHASETILSTTTHSGPRYRDHLYSIIQIQKCIIFWDASISITGDLSKSDQTLRVKITIYIRIGFCEYRRS